MIDFKNRPIALEFAKYIKNEKISSCKLEDLRGNSKKAHEL